MHGIRHLPPGHQTPVNSSRFNKTRRPFGDPTAETKGTPRFIPPPFTNLQNLVLPLDIVLRKPEEEKRIGNAGKLVFHCVGDTGGIHGTEAQEAVAHAMEAQIQSAAATDRPAFFYHLGDVVYFNGLRDLYGVQFYDPYKYYPAPIFAIPGNHDGDTQTRPGDTPDHEPSLSGFIDNFCDSQPKHLDTYRETMTQPYVYWVLEAPFATVIGLYSNVDGSLDGRGTNEQQRWIEGQMRSAPADKCLIVAVHHPPYSLDSDHGGSPVILAALERQQPCRAMARRRLLGSRPQLPALHPHGERTPDPLRRRGGRRLCQRPRVDAPARARRVRPPHPRGGAVPDHRRGRGPGKLRRDEPRLPASDRRRGHPHRRVFHRSLRRRAAGSPSRHVPVELEDASPGRRPGRSLGRGAEGRPG